MKPITFHNSNTEHSTKCSKLKANRWDVTNAHSLFFCLPSLFPIVFFRNWDGSIRIPHILQVKLGSYPFMKNVIKIFFLKTTMKWKIIFNFLVIIKHDITLWQFQISPQNLHEKTHFHVEQILSYGREFPRHIHWQELMCMCRTGPPLLLD